MHDQKLARLFDRYRTKNDLAALAEVFDAVSPELLRVARHVAGRRLDPEDLVQGTFLAAIEHAATFDVERPLVPWLLGILINQSRSARRRTSTSLPEEAAATIASGTRPLDDAEAHEIDDAVKSALSQLPENYREVLVPHLSEGKKPHQIARDLGRPQGTVRAQIHRGIRLMRRALPAGVSLGVLGVLSTGALADVRARVLSEAARANGLPLGEALGLQAQAASRLLRRRVAAASLAVGIGVAVWFAWPTRPDTGHDTFASRGANDTTTTETAMERATAAGARAPLAGAPSPAVVAPTTVPESFGTVLVHVTDPEGTRPIAGAAVHLMAWGDPLWFEATRTLRTGVEGDVRFERVHPGRIGVHVEHGAQLRYDVLAGRETRIDARRERGLSLDARVVDAAGAPVAGAFVDVYASRGGELVSTSARTDADGRTRLDDVSPHAFAAARAEHFATSQLAWMEHPAYGSTVGWFTGAANAVEVPARVEFRLESGALSLEGRVTDASGTPVVGARVIATSAPVNHPVWSVNGSATFEAAPARATSEANGSFRVDGLTAQPVSVRVEAEGFAVVETSIDARDGRFDPAAFVLHRDAIVHGVVRDRDGAPAAFARIAAFVSSNADAARLAPNTTAPVAAANAPALVTTTAGADGSFRLVGLPAGRVELTARAGGIGPIASTTLELVSGTDREWAPTVEHVATIEGHAYGQDGRFVKTWLVMAVPETDDRAVGTGAESVMRQDWITDPTDFSLQCWIDLSGRFVVPCVGTGPHRLELRPRDAWQGIVQAVRSHVEPGSRGADLRVSRSRGVVHGRVVGADGRRADVVAVTAVSTDVSGVSRAVVDATDGHFTLELAPGRHSILVWPRDGAPQQLTSVEIKADERLDVPDLVVSRTGAARIESTDGALRGVELWRVGGLAFALRSVVERDGLRAWLADGLQPGRFHVSWLDGSGRRLERELDVRAGETARLVVSQP